MIRCTLHGAALKKNVTNMQRVIKRNGNTPLPPPPFNRSVSRNSKNHHRGFSEALDLEQMAATPKATAVSNGAAAASDGETIELEIAKPTRHTLNEILIQYTWSQYICAAVGSFGITPSIAVSSTLYTVS